MTLGRIFGIINLTLSVIMLSIVINALSGGDKDVSLDDRWSVVLYYICLIIGIIQLSITDSKTKFRGLHIANGVLLILSFLVIPLSAVFIIPFAIFCISIMLLVLQGGVVKENEVDEKNNLKIEY